MEQEVAGEGGQVGVGEVDLVHQVSQRGSRCRTLKQTAAGGGPLEKRSNKHSRTQTGTEKEKLYIILYTVEPLYCGHLGDLVKCPV